MYAIKDAMIAKEHSGGDLDAAIFYMDIRSFGKDYEVYYDRARDREGIRFVKARIHSVIENPENRNLILRFADENGAIMEEEFDMLVLSVGLEVPPATLELADRLGVNVNKHKFIDSEPFSPLATSRPGIFTCGTFQGPKDIPASVTEASAAAGLAGCQIAAARGTDTKVSGDSGRDRYLRPGTACRCLYLQLRYQYCRCCRCSRLAGVCRRRCREWSLPTTISLPAARIPRPRSRTRSSRKN